MSKKYTIQDFMTGYKYAYIATARGKKDIVKFQNTKTWFLKALSDALEKTVTEEELSRRMFKRAKIVLSYYVLYETDYARKRYLMTIMDRWAYMDAMFNGVLSLESMKRCADARMRKLRADDAKIKDCFTRCLKKGMDVEDIKRAIRKAA